MSWQRRTGAQPRTVARRRGRGAACCVSAFGLAALSSGVLPASRCAAAPAAVVALHEHRCERNTNEHSTVTFATAPAPRKSRCVRATRRAAPRRGAVSRVVVNHYPRPTARRSRRKIANRNKRYIDARLSRTPHGLRLGRKRKGRHAKTFAPYPVCSIRCAGWCGDTVQYGTEDGSDGTTFQRSRQSTYVFGFHLPSTSRFEITVYTRA